MNWTMPYPWRSRSDSVLSINMSSEPGSESFFCALRPIPRILSLRGRITPVKLKFVNPRATGGHLHHPEIRGHRFGADHIQAAGNLDGGQIGVESAPRSGSRFWFTTVFEKPMLKKNP